MTRLLIVKYPEFRNRGMTDRTIFGTRSFSLMCILASCGFPRPPDIPDKNNIGDSIVDAGVASSMFPSCARLQSACGLGGNDSCCHSLEVPGGMYYRSDDQAWDSDSGDTSSPATVSDFRLDKYEITVGRFRTFVNAGAGTQANPPAPDMGAHTKITGSGWNPSWNIYLTTNPAVLAVAVKCDSRFSTWTDSPADNEERPMNCITWYEAMAFCAWDNGYLPTEAEWNYAAAGGTEQRAYPWSIPPGSLTIDGAHASYSNGSACVGDGLPGCTLTDLVKVGSKSDGDGRWEQSDMAGNVSEWVLDSKFGLSSSYPTPCVDCADLTPTSDLYGRVLRGGSFSEVQRDARTGFRYQFHPMTRSANWGARCARPP